MTRWRYRHVSGPAPPAIYGAFSQLFVEQVYSTRFVSIAVNRILFLSVVEEVPKALPTIKSCLCSLKISLRLVRLAVSCEGIFQIFNINKIFR